MTAENPATNPAIAAAIDRELVQALRGDPVAWPKCGAGPLRTRIRFHGVAAILAARPPVMAAAGEHERAAVEGEASLRRIWEETHRAALVAALKQMARRAVRPLVMKGTMLAYSIYPEPAMRQRGEIDLIVRPEQLSAARPAQAVPPTILGTLRQSADKPGTAIPDEIARDLARQTGACMVAHYLGQASATQMLRRAVVATPGWRAKLAELLFHLFPGRPKLRQLHPEYPDWSLLLLHARCMLTFVWKQCFGVQRHG